MKKILIFDSPAVVHAVKHSMPKGLSHNSVPTNIIYGFLNHLLHIQKFTRADLTAFCWDSRKSKRKKLFPGYKIKRHSEEKTEEELELESIVRQQITLLRKKVLPSLGFVNNFRQKGYEGDDLIAKICEDYPNSFITIISRDGDLYQLLNDYVQMYDWINNKRLTAEWFERTHGIPASMWGQSKSIWGCTTDEVPGIEGVGKGYAKKYLLGELNPKTLTFAKIANGKKTIKLTKKLVVLPFKGTKSCILQPDNVTLTKVKKVAKTYGLKSHLTNTRLSDWRKAFNAN